MDMVSTIFLSFFNLVCKKKLKNNESFYSLIENDVSGFE